MSKKILVGKLIVDLMAGLSARQKEVLESRFGLKNKEKMTLAEIGDRYGVTRERIRQIEAIALIALKSKLENNKDFLSFVDAVVNHLNKLGGARRAALLSLDLKKMSDDKVSDKSFSNKISFILEVSGKFKHNIEDNNYNPFWYLNDESKQQVESFTNNLTEVLVANGDWQSAVRGVLAENHLSLSKKFAVNSYDDFGLVEWDHINPKTARDWAFLVLKKKQKPMHFSQLAKVINTMRKGRVTNVQTVHNELIKDSRFILVGRGIYGLKEFNLVAGTCREVISQILKENGPQNSKSVIKLVTSKRDFKENTLILNLQNKKHFIRLNDGRYTLREV